MSKGFGISRAESLTGNIPAIRYGEIYTNHNDYIRNFTSFISEEIAKKARRLQFGDLLFTASGETKEEIGKCVAFIDDYNAYAGGDIIIVSNTQQSPIFLGYTMNAPTAVRQKATFGQGDTVVHITASALGLVQIPLPPLEEQKRIAEVLSHFDQHIENLSALLEKKKQIKSAAMHQIIPRSALMLPLGKLLDYEQPSDYIVNEIIFFKRGSLPVLTAGASFILGYTNESSGVFKATTDNPVIIFDDFTTSSQWVDFDFKVKSSAMKMLRLREDSIVILRYLFYVMSLITYKPMIHERQWISIYSKLEVPIPPIDEQRRIVRILSNMDKEIEDLEQLIEKYQQLKQGAMQELLTGKTRLL